MATIMIFDDDTDTLEICTLILRDKGYAVFTETSCENVIEKILRNSPQVIFMDNKIPDMGGIIASNSLKASSQFQHIPILFFSANADVQKLAAEAQADLFMEKPFDLDELAAVVKSAIG